jgi:UDP-N-acetyl-D-glucosamine dehydrogenase
MLTLQQQVGTQSCGQRLSTGGEEDYLLDKISSRQASVAIIGLGYVGLPLAVAFAEAGFHVTGIDIDQKRVDSLNAGRSHVSDVPSEKLALFVANAEKEARERIRLSNRAMHRGMHTNGDAAGQSNGTDVAASGASAVQGTFQATTDYDVLYDMDAVIICVPTPLSRTKDPDCPTSLLRRMRSRTVCTMGC